MTIIQDTAVAASAPAARQRRRSGPRDGRTAFFFLLPSLLGVILFLVVPIIASIQIVVKELTTERRARMAALRGPPDTSAGTL